MPITHASLATEGFELFAMNKVLQCNILDFFNYPLVTENSVIKCLSVVGEGVRAPSNVLTLKVT